MFHGYLWPQWAIAIYLIQRIIFWSADDQSGGETATELVTRLVSSVILMIVLHFGGFW